VTPEQKEKLYQIYNEYEKSEDFDKAFVQLYDNFKLSAKIGIPASSRFDFDGLEFGNKHLSEAPGEMVYFYKKVFIKTENGSIEILPAVVWM
jgi:hypothetical protein